MATVILILLSISYLVWLITSTIFLATENKFEFILCEAIYKDWDWQIFKIAKGMNKRGKKLTLIFSVIAFPLVYIVAIIYRFCHDLKE